MSWMSHSAAIFTCVLDGEGLSWWVDMTRSFVCVLVGCAPWKCQSRKAPRTAHDFVCDAAGESPLRRRSNPRHTLDTIKNGMINIERFQAPAEPSTLMLAMGCAEVGSATWLMFATKMGMPVSTTQTIVGALVGVGFATNAGVTWGWESGYVSQIAASWVIAPLIACAFSAMLFGTVKYAVLEREDSFKRGMRLISWYFAATGAILALFGVFVGVLVFSYIFFMPYLERKLVKKDARLRIWRIPLGPLLKRENPPLYFAGKADGEYVKNYYADAYGEVRAQGQELRQRNNGDSEKHPQNVDDNQKTSPGNSKDGLPTNPEEAAALEEKIRSNRTPVPSSPRSECISSRMSVSLGLSRSFLGPIPRSSGGTSSSVFFRVSLATSSPTTATSFVTSTLAPTVMMSVSSICGRIVRSSPR